MEQNRQGHSSWGGGDGGFCKAVTLFAGSWDMQTYPRLSRGPRLDEGSKEVIDIEFALETTECGPQAAAAVAAAAAAAKLSLAAHARRLGNC